MRQLINRCLLIVTVMSSILAPSMAVTPSAYAAVEPLDKVCNQAGARSTTVCGDRGRDNRIFDIIRTIISILLILAGMIAVVMIILGGLKYVTSGGDANSTKTAKDTVLYSVVGLVVAIMSYAIVNFVLGRL